jgi:hypothetical protein
MKKTETLTITVKRQHLKDMLAMTSQAILKYELDSRPNVSKTLTKGILRLEVTGDIDKVNAFKADVREFERTHA